MQISKRVHSHRTIKLHFTISNNISPPRRLFCNIHVNACFRSLILQEQNFRLNVKCEFKKYKIRHENQQTVNVNPTHLTHEDDGKRYKSKRATCLLTIYMGQIYVTNKIHVIIFNK